MWVSPGDLLTRLCSNAHSLVIAAPYVKTDALSRVLGACPIDPLSAGLAKQ